MHGSIEKIELRSMNWEFGLIWRALTRYYLPQRVFTKRWLIPLILLPLFTGYMMLEVLTLAQQLGTASNTWDVVSRALNDRLWVHHGLTNFLIYLLSDIALLRDASPAILARAGSRSAWFLILIFCVLVTVFTFSVLLALILFAVTTPIMPLAPAWSSAAAPLFTQQKLSAAPLLAVDPLQTVLSMLALLALAWTAIGIVVTTVTLKTQNAIYGFLSGLALNYSAFIFWISGFESSLMDAIWLHQRMFFWQTGEATDSLFSQFIFGVGYWIVWSAVSGMILWGICRKLDLVAKNQVRNFVAD